MPKNMHREKQTKTQDCISTSPFVGNVGRKHFPCIKIESRWLPRDISESIPQDMERSLAPFALQ